MSSEIIEDVLKYIGLDLENVPEYLYKATSLDFRPSNIDSENEYRTYKYVPIDKIQVLLTEKNSLETLSQKYAKAKPIYKYLKPDTEENMKNYALFLNMLRQANVENIEALEKEQVSFKTGIPFEIKYNKSYDWQIYYSELDDKYFMLVSTEQTDFDRLFLLLKMQIEYFTGDTKTAPELYVPINNNYYSGKFLKKSEISSMENYLWLFTKHWPVIYEVYDSNNEYSLNIIGETFVYENVKAKYKMLLKQKDEAIDSYNYVKALFVMQTELKNHYIFKSKINFNNEIEFFYNNKKIEYSKLPDFITEEYAVLSSQKENFKLDYEKKNEELKELKAQVRGKEKEYLEKQKQIATFLECKKTFLGKVKYYFKKKKEKVETLEEQEELTQEEQVNSLEEKAKKYYTIEDLVLLHYYIDKEEKKLKDADMDISAQKEKLVSLSSKVKNANTYISEIESHKKSIFEFWRFASKDETKLLEAGEDSKKEDNKKIKKVFDFKMDFEQMGIAADTIQETSLTKEELDSVYLANIDVLDTLNNMSNIEQLYSNLKNKQDSKPSIDNIFGSISDNSSGFIGNKKHREVKKDKFKILEFTRNTTLEELKEKLEDVSKNLKSACNKIKSLYDMNIYAFSKEPKSKEYTKYSMNVQELFAKTAINSNTLDLYKISIKENMPLVYFSNLAFYDNYNKTLPKGMNLSEDVLLDNSMYEFELKNEIQFVTNMYNEKCEKPINVTVHEYDVKLKK